jgi:adenosylcobinamide kinase / adenosylcobinamide-phosphate guanylyltransferase
MYTFVTGGYRSGRSNYALRRAAELGQPPWLYVSTGQDDDEAVRSRIQRHRRDVEAIWRTTVMPVRLLDLLQPAGGTPSPLEGAGAAVIDGIAGWIETRVAGTEESADKDLLEEMTVFAARLYRSAVPLVVTSTEMGLGVLPHRKEDLRLMRVVTSANQILVQQASGVVLMVSGAPFKVM